MLVRNARLHITFVRKKYHERTHIFRATCEGTNGVYIRILLWLLELNGEGIHPILRSPIVYALQIRGFGRLEQIGGKN